VGHAHQREAAQRAARRQCGRRPQQQLLPYPQQARVVLFGSALRSQSKWAVCYRVDGWERRRVIRIPQAQHTKKAAAAARAAAAAALPPLPPKSPRRADPAFNYVHLFMYIFRVLQLAGEVREALE
jgi:hypothetical protein